MRLCSAGCRAENFDEEVSFYSTIQSDGAPQAVQRPHLNSSKLTAPTKCIAIASLTLPISVFVRKMTKAMVMILRHLLFRRH